MGTTATVAGRPPLALARSSRIRSCCQSAGLGGKEMTSGVRDAATRGGRGSAKVVMETWSAPMAMQAPISHGFHAGRTLRAPAAATRAAAGRIGRV